ncbi:flagellin [Pseudomonadales bacterium]|nr:flagellin [Pseudomonadales bacterium]MDC0894989.1 flagellin [Pseudomonadales bacterium]
MSLVVNTNVSSLTAQRGLAESGDMLDKAMARLSSGSRINSASDDAAGLAIVQRMSAQINGLNMAVKNANDGISLTQSIEGALVEVVDMLQRVRELAVQSANDTNTNTDRAFLQEEVNLLIAEITRVSANTRFNQTTVLDGSFSNKILQVGTEGGETIQFSVDSVSSDKLGAYKITGDRIAATEGDGNGVFLNQTDDADDIIINGNSLSKTIAVAAKDSAANVATNINAVSGETGVSAVAKSYAHYYSTWNADQTASLKINNKTTGQFVVSSTNVLDAIDKINSISGSTGVTASATSDNKVLLYASDGRDILVENETSILGQRVAAVSHDGTSVAALSGAVAGVKETADNDAAGDGSTITWYIRNQHTGESTSVSFVDNATQSTSVSNLNTALGNLGGKWAAGGDYHLTAAVSNTNKITLTGTTALGDFQVFEDSAMSTSALETTSDTLGKLGTHDVRLLAAGTTAFEGNSDTGDSATIQGTISLSSSKLFSVTQSGTEAATNDNYFTTGAATLSTVSNVDLRNQAGASNAISVLDGAIEKISSMRADLGAIENRLSYTVSNLMNVAENTADARSRINDADYSVESANLAKAQVLQQAGTAMLSQANARAQLVLQLLQ